MSEPVVKKPLEGSRPKFGDLPQNLEIWFQTTFVWAKIKNIIKL